MPRTETLSGRAGPRTALRVSSEPLNGVKDILAAAGSIVQVEARHAAAIRLLRGETPAPEAFDRTLDKGAVLKAVKPLVKA